MSFVANFIVFLTVKELCRSVKFWPCYSELNLARFLGRSVHGLSKALGISIVNLCYFKVGHTM